MKFTATSKIIGAVCTLTLAALALHAQLDVAQSTESFDDTIGATSRVFSPSAFARFDAANPRSLTFDFAYPSLFADGNSPIDLDQLGFDASLPIADESTRSSYPLVADLERNAWTSGPLSSEPLVWNDVVGDLLGAGTDSTNDGIRVVDWALFFGLQPATYAVIGALVLGALTMVRRIHHRSVALAGCPTLMPEKMVEVPGVEPGCP